VTVRPRRSQQQLPTTGPPLERMIVRSQAEECTRVPERLLQPLFEHTDDYSETGVARRPPEVVISPVYREIRASGVEVGRKVNLRPG
jgi:hypothetical protein